MPTLLTNQLRSLVNQHGAELVMHELRHVIQERIERAGIPITASDEDRKSLSAATLVAIAEALERKRDLPYPFCRHPDDCRGRGYCRHDPACND
jgi:hypothetical protein